MGKTKVSGVHQDLLDRGVENKHIQTIGITIGDLTKLTNVYKSLEGFIERVVFRDEKQQYDYSFHYRLLEVISDTEIRMIFWAEKD